MSEILKTGEGTTSQLLPEKNNKQWLSSPRRLFLGLGIGAGLILLATQIIPSQTSSVESSSSKVGLTVNSVTVANAQTVPIRQTIDANGTVEAFDLLSVTPRANGLQIQSVMVKEGDFVTVGQVLAILDDTVLRNQIAQAEAEVVSDTALINQAKAEASQAEAALDEAIDNLSRYESLFEQGAISEEDLVSRQTQVTTARQTLAARNAAIDSAKASANSSQAEVAQLLTQLDQTQVFAPANGIIAEQNATLGDIASTANSLFQLISDGELELEVKIPQSQLSQIDVGAPAEIRSNSDPSLQFQGSVRSINPTVDIETRQATVNIGLPSNSQLRPGMFLQVTIVTTNRQGVAIPFTAVLPQDNGEFIVYLLNTDDTVQMKTVEVGERIPSNEGKPDQIEIVSGLQTDTSVVVEGAAYLQDGDKVLILGEE